MVCQTHEVHKISVPWNEKNLTVYEKTSCNRNQVKEGTIYCQMSAVTASDLTYRQSAWNDVMTDKNVGI